MKTEFKLARVGCLVKHVIVLQGSLLSCFLTCAGVFNRLANEIGLLAHVISNFELPGSTKIGKINDKMAPVNSMLITGTITAKQTVRQKVPGLYAVCR